MGTVRAEVGSTALARPRVDALLSGARTRRLTLVTAGGGHGKTIALRGLVAPGDRWLELRPVDREIELLAARLAEALQLGTIPGLAEPGAAIGAEDRLGLAEAQAAALCHELAHRGREQLLVVDNLERIGADSAAAHLLRAVVLQAPSNLHLVLAGRRLPELGIGASRPVDELLELAAPDLAFTASETAELLAERLGATNQDVVERCHHVTGGWAAALAVLADRLSRVEPQVRVRLLDRLMVLDGRVWREFVADLLERESPNAQRALLLGTVAPLVHADLLAALGIDEPRALLAGLTSRGLLVSAIEDEAARMSPVLMAAVSELAPQSEVMELRIRAADWLESAGRLGESLECRVNGPDADVRAFLERRGATLLTRGYGPMVAEVLRSLSIGDDRGLRALLGASLQSFGDWDGAVEAFTRLRRDAEHGVLEPHVAWRFGALLYLRGQTADALEVLSAAGRGESDTVTADDALVSAWLSSTLWARGDVGTAAEVAVRALGQAERSNDLPALAAAHVACALAAASRGEREQNERHYRAALQAAKQAGDSIQLARIRANLSSRAFEEGDYGRAIAEADSCLQVGAGHRFFAALAMCNKADALIQLGDLASAHANLVESIAIFESLGSLLASAPHTMLGTLFFERGDMTRARMAFERAQRLAEAGDDAHTLVETRCGLARSLAADDADAARGFVGEAVSLASSLERAHALCTAARIELVAGDLPAARAVGADAEREARATGDRRSLAEALVVQALAHNPVSIDGLEAAAELWDEIGNAIARARVLLLLAGCRQDEQQVAALRAELSRLGVSDAFEPGLRAETELSIVTLGRFAVYRNGAPVSAGEWQSKKARDLLKLLVSRLGKPMPREAVAEALWPGEAPEPLANRLSVALSTVRKVLDPDRRYPSDQYVAADNQSVSLKVEQMCVDVVEFLRIAHDAVRDRDEDRLHEADRIYVGDFLEADLYEDWTVDCREQARAAALDVSRMLAGAAGQRGDDETVTRHLRRVLEHDGYDEEAWVGLVGAQFRMRRHGEARRQHAIYARRMAELGIAPQSFADATRERG